MTRATFRSLVFFGAIVCGSIAAATGHAADQSFSFRSAAELINVTATVTDENGRFVSGLKASDFELYEDDKLQTIQQFDTERVPVSLGIAIDTSTSMVGEKIAAAQAALNRFLVTLLGDDDEVFLYRFAGQPILVHDWTRNRQELARAVGDIKVSGGTALYDTVAEAVPLAQGGSRRKKALLIISDGNDTSSRTRPQDLTPLIRGSEVLVYAIGIDASDGVSYSAIKRQPGAPSAPGTPSAPKPIPVPSPFPGSPGPQMVMPKPAPAAPTPSPMPGRRPSGANDRINVEALRRITDDSGGRTEVIVSPRDLDPATSSIADELSRQYFIGYASSLPKDGRWHTIELRMARPGAYTVRARKGFVAN